MRTVVYLLRHGDYENPKNIFHGRLPGFPLSKNGIRQVKLLASVLKSKPIVAIYTSPLARAKQTAEIIVRFQKKPIQIIEDTRLLDIRTPLQGKSRTFMDSIKWNFYHKRYIRAGGETLEEISERMRSFFGDILVKHKGKHLVIVTHGDPIMVLKVKYLGERLSVRNVHSLDYVPMAGGYEIVFDTSGRVMSLASLKP